MKSFVEIIPREEGIIMNFTAIDFETANSKRSSACALGITVVRDNKITKKKQWIIKPKDMVFDWYNTKIHGMTEKDVYDKPEFNEIWDEVRPYLESNLVVAHNAPFDLSVLKGLAEEYSLDIPEITSICTRKLARKVWPCLFSYKLYTVAKRHLHIDFKHHNAEDDSYACAMILIKAMEELNIKEEEELFNLINPTYRRKHYKLDPKEIVSRNTEFDEDNPFYKKNIVFTGTLESMTRREAMQKVIDVGGLCTNAITKTSNYLVIGIQDYTRLVNGDKSSKMVKAEQFISNGQELEIITEDELLNMI